MKRVARVAWYRFVSTFRRRRNGYLAIVLLVGVVGGLAMASVSGARRTQGAFPLALARTHASDLQFGPYFNAGDYQSNLYTPSFGRKLARLPHVAHVAAAVSVAVAPLRANGRPHLPAPLLNNIVQTAGGVNGEYTRTDQLVVNQGRLANPSRIDEFVATAQSVRLLHWHLGEELYLGAFTLKQIATSGLAVPQTPVLRFHARLVGIVTPVGAAVHDEVDQYPTTVVFTPALTRRLIALKGAFFPDYELSLEHGSSDVSSVEREITAALPPGTLYAFHVTSVVAGQAERSTRPDSLALGVFGAIAALAMILLTALAIGRQLAASAVERDVLRALGAGPAITSTDSLLGTSGAIGLGALVAVGLCVLLSPFAPIGSVRAIDPSPGFVVDGMVIGVGVTVILGGLGATTVAMGLLTTRLRYRTRRSARSPRGSLAVRAALRSGLSLPGVMGVRFAAERGQRGDAVAMRSSIVGAALAIVVVTATLTFGSGLSTLVSNPSLYGWNWSYALDEISGDSVPPMTRTLLSQDPDVAAFTGFSTANIDLDGQTVPALIVSTHARVAPPIVAGHGVDTLGQIVLGAGTLAQLHTHIGATVVGSYGNPRSAPFYVPPTPLRVVGTATFPSIGSPGQLHVSVGSGAMIGNVEPATMQAALRSPDKNLNGPTVVVIRLRRGVSPAAGRASLERIAHQTTVALDKDPNFGGGAFEVYSVRQPAEIVNYRASGSAPLLLAAALALGAVMALGLALVTLVGRRRRDLALLKALGFTKRQLASCVAWQSSVAAAVGLVVGVPSGVVLGRWLWRLFAQQIFVVPRATVPIVSLVFVVVGALVLANLVAVVPGRHAARTPAALVLRGE
ncbi:MAG: ABC transporter permease [Acidimicrobiales bacterium]